MSKLDEAAEKAQESRDTICSVKCDGCYIDGYRAGFMKAIEIAEKNKISPNEEMEDLVFIDDLKNFAGEK
jgi:hypothetical protein